MEETSSIGSGLAASSSPECRRAHPRIQGPFDGRRIGTLVTALTIYDLSEGGCFINSMFEQTPGVIFTLEIDLPYAGSFKVKAETLYARPGFGFAVRFVEASVLDTLRLQQALDELRTRAQHDL